MGALDRENRVSGGGNGGNEDEHDDVWELKKRLKGRVKLNLLPKLLKLDRMIFIQGNKQLSPQCHCRAKSSFTTSICLHCSTLL
jgi:hypothetical protein